MKKSTIIATAVTAVVLAFAPAAAASANTVSPDCQSSNYGPSSSFDQNIQCRLQEGPAARNGYTGPVDGNMGTNSWKGVQCFLSRYFNYTGAIDGAPGTLTYKALQRWASNSADHRNGVFIYSGPIDGAMGSNSWKGTDGALETDYYSPAIRYNQRPGAC